MIFDGWTTPAVGGFRVTARIGDYLGVDFDAEAGGFPGGDVDLGGNVGGNSLKTVDFLTHLNVILRWHPFCVVLGLFGHCLITEPDLFFQFLDPGAKGLHAFFRAIAVHQS